MQKPFEHYLQVIFIPAGWIENPWASQIFCKVLGITSGGLATGPAIIPLAMRPALGLDFSFPVDFISSETAAAFKSSRLSFNFLSQAVGKLLLWVVPVWHFSLLC